MLLQVVGQRLAPCFVPVVCTRSGDFYSCFGFLLTDPILLTISDLLHLKMLHSAVLLCQSASNAHIQNGGPRLAINSCVSRPQNTFCHYKFCPHTNKQSD